MQAKTAAVDREQAASTPDKDAKKDKSKQKPAPTPIPAANAGGKPPQTKEESKVLEGMIQANESKNFDFTLAKPQQLQNAVNGSDPSSEAALGGSIDQLKAEEGIIDEIEGKKLGGKPNTAKTEPSKTVSAAVEDGPKDTAVEAKSQKLTPAPSIGKPSP
jgi:hypothetical protein